MKEINRLLVHNYFRWNEPMSWLAWTIRKATGKIYNHAALLVNIEGYFYVIHAVYPRVVIVDFETWLKEKERKYTIMPITCNNPSELKRKALLQIDKKYDLWNLFFYMPIYLLTGIWLGNKSSEKLQCYELVSYVLSEKDSYKAKPFLKTTI